jgi:hypothetical protein
VRRATVSEGCANRDRGGGKARQGMARQGKATEKENETCQFHMLIAFDKAVHTAFLSKLTSLDEKTLLLSAAVVSMFQTLVGSHNSQSLSEQIQ